MEGKETGQCLYNYATKLPPCVVLRVNKYSYLIDFIHDKKGPINDYSIALKIECIEFQKDHINIKNDNCINCMFCVFGCPGNNIEIRSDLSLKAMCSNFSIDYDNKYSLAEVEKLFKGTFLKLPQIKFNQFKVKYKSFQEFNEKDETTNIAVWGANLLKYLSKNNNPRIGLEVGMIIKSRGRGGRLDICLLNNDLLFVAETKVNFDKMMNEDRYVSQLLAYEDEIKIAIVNTKISHFKFLVIGGPESDLLPQTHPDCTSKVGNRANKFYDSVIKNNLFFISANALLSLGLVKLLKGNQYSIEDIAGELFKSGNFGLLSCGIVKSLDENIIIENFN